MTPLHDAARNEKTEVATLLINSGANLEAINKVSTMPHIIQLTESYTK